MAGYQWSEHTEFIILVEFVQAGYATESWWFDVSEKGVARPAEPVPGENGLEWRVDQDAEVPEGLEDYLMEELGREVSFKEE